ncbi:MAG: peptidylprolyl isomerase [Planctomycetes bacterium]|nr:peptidylprolyl isomerase [Planctomycetota bacterium]
MQLRRFRGFPIAMTLLGAACALPALPGGYQAAAEEPTTQPRGAEPPAAEGGKVYVHMVTTLGDMVLELYADKAPATVQNFLEYVDSGFYQSTTFHRVMGHFMAQGGGRTADGNEKPGRRAPIKNEATNGLKNTAHTLAMARTPDPHSASSEFFINFVDNARLDHKDQQRNWGYCVFGKVIAGADTLEAIRKTPVEIDARIDPKTPVRPISPVVIEKIARLGAESVEATCKGCKANAQAAEAALAKGKANTPEGQFATAMEMLKSRGVDIAKGQKTASGLWVLHIAEGSGTAPLATDRVEVHYTGSFPNGEQFDSSRDRGTTSSFALTQVVKGWTEGLQLMKPGGKAYLVVPANLAYGKRGRSGIPPDATLVFDIELVKVNP